MEVVSASGSVSGRKENGLLRGFNAGRILRLSGSRAKNHPKVRWFLGHLGLLSSWSLDDRFFPT
jgi:hypothetical protein